VRTVAPEVGEAALAALPNAAGDLTGAVLPSLINELAAAGRRLVLVLDDYHCVRNESIHASVAFFLRHLPANVQLAIATRADPPLPLGSLRAAGEVLEIRAAQLGFSDAEAGALLNDSLALGLEPADVALLRDRTEGWPAGLRLAALSLRDVGDPKAFVAAFAGDDRQIVEYLQEFVTAQPRRLREFLLRTSILERLCGPAGFGIAVMSGRGAGSATPMHKSCRRGPRLVRGPPVPAARTQGPLRRGTARRPGWLSRRRRELRSFAPWREPGARRPGRGSCGR
jgi:ATP/maltotriose-dependent transcriptional regulator MalT